MKALLVTGTLAEDAVKRYAQESSVKTDVYVLKVPVAALLTPDAIAKALKAAKTEGFDVILVPGLIRGDTTVISNAIGVPAFKGPRYAADLPTVLDSLGEVTLSTVTPACDLLRDKLRQKALEELDKVERNRERLLKNPGNMLIKNLAVGKDFPMRVMAEVVDAPLMPTKEVKRLTATFVKLGADVVDVGMVAGESRPADARKLVEAVKSVVDVPVSIDSLDPAEIKAAVEAGADLILSVDAGNVEAIAPFASEVAVVAIPTNQREGYFPKKAEERVKFLEEIIQKARKLGITRVMGDLILEPSNILESMLAFRMFSAANPEVPLFVGVSNVTELFDADSVGVNALLARLSSEVGASMLLATEKSDKAKGTVREEVTAAKMMFLAKMRGSVPKDLGLDLLVLKDKRNREEPYDRTLETNVHVAVTSEKPEPVVLDEKGSFRIAVDRVDGNIVALHYTSLGLDKPVNIIKGKTADSVYMKIAELGLVTRIDHAAYLGSELAKAEIALKTGKQYLQDHSLF
ncbi:MAG: dihydropteroate synthase-like protein [Candidatus Bathyarchaeota archaeon]|nr:dihydropteroate synthase-like protein [Candidatus Bathyarchaeota archaeon]